MNSSNQQKMITIVSGLPRSGTSMMMNMLEAGGMGIIVDHIRVADGDNLKGYFEFDAVKKIKEDISWLKDAHGKAVKVVSMLLYDLPSMFDYRIIFMRRNMGEILISQRKMLEKMGEKNIPADEEMGMLYDKHLKNISIWLENQANMKVLCLNYKDVLENPCHNAQKISEFLDTHLNTERMIQVVDASLQRNRKMQESTIEKGIKSEFVSEDDEKKKIVEQLRALGYM